MSFNMKKFTIFILAICCNLLALAAVDIESNLEQFQHTSGQQQAVIANQLMKAYFDEQITDEKYVFNQLLNPTHTLATSVVLEHRVLLRQARLFSWLGEWERKRYPCAAARR